ncbi:Cytochrome b5 [Handroanthus impetiginosus]|uniref:Cytochrome b5 n=1 Tax=Handroanthus impetiginosus TaxID=429701 RepID=A0A2G9H0A7_9LAMI|nr:Cytochrome b5 [Handroanthus impetiginosus]
MAKEFTMAEVAEHTSRNDCWVVLFGKVYNVTTFLDEHPGGDEILLNATGKDATDEFDDIGHSHDAWAMLEKYYIGEANKSTIPTKTIPSTHPLGVDTKGKKSKYMAYVIQFLVPLIILNVVVALFSKSSA